MPHLLLVAALAALALSSCASAPPPPPTAVKPVKLGLALGGGAARGFAHVGVIKTLESQGIFPDIIVGTSAGAVVGALYAAGHNGFELQKLAHRLDEKKISDWSLPDRGVLKGESLQQFVNEAVGQRPLEALKKPFGAVATEVSADPDTAAAQGYAGCASPEQASQAFGGDYTNVAVGDLFGPTVQSDVWVIVRIGSTTGPTLEQMTPELEAQLGAEDEQAVTTRLAELVIGAVVTVDPRYGTWDPETGTITPPPAGTTTTTAATAVTGP